MLRLIFLIISMNYGSNGFLLDSTTKLPSIGNSGLSDRHYIQLMDSLYEERKARQNLEVIVTDLMKKVQTTTTNQTRSNEQDAKIEQLEQNYATVLHELALVKDQNRNLSYQRDILKTVQSISEMTSDINALKATNQARKQDFIAINKVVQTTLQKLQNVSTLLESNSQNDHNILDMKGEVNALKATNQARMQDLIAMNAIATTTSKKLDNVTKQLDSNVKIVTALNSNMTQMKDRQSQIWNQIQKTQQTVTRNSKEVMIRACDASTDSSSLIRFRTIKESYGISNAANFIASGKFTCEDAGLYILMVILFADQHGGYAYIYKNANIIQNLETIIPNNELYHHSIPGSLALFLKIGDTIHVQAHIMDFGRPSDTCLSIIKVR